MITPTIAISLFVTLIYIATFGARNCIVPCDKWGTLGFDVRLLGTPNGAWRLATSSDSFIPSAFWIAQIHTRGSLSLVFDKLLPLAGILTPLAGLTPGPATCAVIFYCPLSFQMRCRRFIFRKRTGYSGSGRMKSSTGS
jgi:hypothetical protein